jgi:alpha-mannosidase
MWASSPSVLADKFVGFGQKATALQQSYCWYNGSDGRTAEDPYQASGAYVFRPNTSSCFPLKSSDESMTVFRGPLVEEVHQSFAPWLSQVVWRPSFSLLQF